MKKLKTVIAVMLTALMIGSMLTCFAEAGELKPFVYVTVYDGKTVVAAAVKVEKADEDEDGKWTINDALITLHKDRCADGYATAPSQYGGEMITKLWGIENGGSYGYFRNNVSCMGLTEELSEAEADHIYAFVYSDAARYSDAYSFFNVFTELGEENGKLTLTAKYVSGYDPETYAQIDSPLADAVITFDGVDTEFKTDENGSVEITLPAENTLISAKKDGLLLVPPVCAFTAFKAPVETVTESAAVPETTAAPGEKMKDPFVYVTVYDGKTLVAVNVKVKKSDEDKDGKWTINDALTSIHNAKCKNGYETDANGMIKKLWNVENGGAYGYYRNNIMCMGLTEELSEYEPDHLYAFVYTDTTGWSDAYSFFDKYELSGKVKEKATLMLKYVSGFDPETYAPIISPLADAEITFNGEKRGKTDENGVYEFEFSSVNGTLSAKKEGLTLIPPVCSYTVEESHTHVRLIWVIILTVVLAAAVVCVIIFNNKKRKKAN